jgi:hypothetical protein
MPNSSSFSLIAPALFSDAASRLARCLVFAFIPLMPFLDRLYGRGEAL